VQVVSVFSGSPLSGGEGSGVRVATLVNYACHGTVLGPDNLLVSADWIGVMRKKTEEELGGLTLFIQGAAANINPDMFWEDARAFEMVAEQGLGVANAVIAATGSGAEKMRGVPIQIERTQAWLPTETRVTTSHPPRNYGKKLLSLAKMPGFMAVFADFLLKQRYPWKSVIEARNGFWSVPMRINAVRIGELAFVTFAAETFTEIGMKVKSASPAKQTLFASVSDGCISYLHTEESHPEGGYEVDIAPLAYRYPGRLQAVCEKIALATTNNLLEKLWS